jgi:hypothetical protein
MIKKFNEDWNALHWNGDEAESYETFMIYRDEKLDSILRRAKDFALKKDTAINFDYKGMGFVITKYTDVEKLIKEYGESKQKFKKGDLVKDINFNEYAEVISYDDKKKEYFVKFDSGETLWEIDNNLEGPLKKRTKLEDKNGKFKVDDHVMITRGIFAGNHGKVSRIDNNGKYVIGAISGIEEDKLELYKDPKEKKIEFKRGYEVIGLPSGQVIYMTTKQVEWFKARKVIKFYKTWKKPIGGGYVPIEIDKFCFEDVNYKKITDMMDTITW